MSKSRLIEAKFIGDLQDEVTRLTRQVERMRHTARLKTRRISALKDEIARLERDQGSRSGSATSATLAD